MQVVRTYSSLTDAQLGQLSLEAEGVASDILDEGTASVAPHLAFASGIRLAVADEDFDRAREILGLPPAMPAARPKGGIPWWFFAVVGVAVITIIVQASRQNRPSAAAAGQTQSIDRNGDGRADQQWQYDRNGRLTTGWADNNFDGRWDEKTEFKNDVPVRHEADLDFDGTFDAVTDYQRGLPETTTIRRGGKGPILTLTTWRDNRIASVLEDSNADGRWDRRLEYDPFGLIVKQEDLH